MPALIIFGRVLFAVLFIYLGATKLFAIQPTADVIAAKVTIPGVLTPYTTQVETATGMTLPQLLAIGGGIFETIAGLMIAFNFAARFFSIILILYVAAGTFYFHDFWNQTPPENGKAYWMVFSNKGRLVKRGNHVAVVIGAFHADGLIVD